MQPGNAIEVRHVTKTFRIESAKNQSIKEKILYWNRGDSHLQMVLDDVSVDIKKGETVALIGTNGSGKSTLLKMMTKIYYPNSGTIETKGKLTSLLELGAGFHPNFTGRENIYFNASIFGLNKKEIEERMDDIIEFSELGDFIDNEVRTYSSGMYMRLAFSVAINVDADILLIDEILAVGDQHFQEKCYHKLHELRDSGKTIVIVTHTMEVVREMCHRAIWIYKGKFKLDGDPSYVIDEYMKQITLDHKEKVKAAVERGESGTGGQVFIDEPKGLTHPIEGKDAFKVRGWSISDHENAKLIVKIDGKEIKGIQREPRPDVYQAKMQDYPTAEANTLGWIKEMECDEIGLGAHRISAALESNGSIISSVEADFLLE